MVSLMWVRARCWWDHGRCGLELKAIYIWVSRELRKMSAYHLWLLYSVLCPFFPFCMLGQVQLTGQKIQEEKSLHSISQNKKETWRKSVCIIVWITSTSSVALVYQQRDFQSESSFWCFVLNYSISVMVEQYLTFENEWMIVRPL